jgi:glutamine synthetase
MALALMLGAGLDGMRRKIKPPPEMKENVFESHAHAGILPTTLEEALQEMEKDDLVSQVLGEHVVREFIKLKREEIRNYTAHISQWELDRYLEW